MASQSLCNGERAVVLLFISAILFSTPSSLFSKPWFSSFLPSPPSSSTFASTIPISLSPSRPGFSLFSLNFIEFSSCLPGASSGIFLGAVTLPAVMISRLIQLSRAFSLHEVGIKVAFTYHNFLFSQRLEPTL
ncbi:hypothetical protein CK203_004644 [Vitis vinifera]|uniref:Uncharacterized protein n=1 Tax=Vitis vinifera TaxID=29760 RepID=A0A438KFM3_VITVI|nr:hypothetical protein CK203_004644 [Vitis vinifera]